MITDCNMLMRPYILGVTVITGAGCLPHTFYTHDLTYRTKTPLFGAVFIAIMSMTSGDRLCAFKCWSCHLLRVILLCKTGMIIARPSQGGCGTKCVPLLESL